MTDWLRRETAPLSERVWSEIESVAVKMAKQTLVARRILDLNGPRGWGYVATQLDTFRPPAEGKSSDKFGRARLALPDVMLLTEIRADFSIPWSSIDLFERVGPALESEAIEEAARDTALAEDRLVFYGRPGAPGILNNPASPRVPLSDWKAGANILTDLLTAVQRLDEVGIKGPYEAVMSPEHYYSYLRTTVGSGYPAAKQLSIVISKVHSSASIEGAALFSTRGGDFLMTVGGDFTLGYRWHDERAIHLFCIETVAAQLLTPEAVCLIRAA
jgi:uncharacterized linocin/CFP29 family protein